MDRGVKCGSKSVLVQLFRSSGGRAFLLSAKDFDGAVYAYSPASQDSKHNLQTKLFICILALGSAAGKVIYKILHAPLSSC